MSRFFFLKGLCNMSEIDLTKYQQLSEIEHVLVRSSIYIGSIVNTTNESFLLSDDKKHFELREVGYNPGLLKLFDEIISNSVDEHIRTGSVSKIEVSLSPLTGEIIVSDNGGIPVQIHPDYGVYVPTMIFGQLRTGSNFDDSERSGAGMNGLGSKLTSIFSKKFVVDTCDGKKRFQQIFTNNLSHITEPDITTGSKKGTCISFIPDYDRLQCSLDEENIEKITKRVYDIAGCNPKIKVYLNGELIRIKSFEEYAGMYFDNGISDNNDDWHIVVGASDEDTFRHSSFVNGIDVFNGGTHIDYIVNQITTNLRQHIQKKHKIDVKPNNIKQQLFLVMKCKINAPMFTSQTKEFLSTDPKDYGTSFVVSTKFMKKLIESDIVEKILNWAEAEQNRKELAELKKMNKQVNNNNFLKRILKFDDATSKDRSECTLILSEGDSAARPIVSCRDANTQGVFPLKGKPLNVRDVKVSKLTSNDEFANLMAILGLKIGTKVTIDDLRFSRILLACDADNDGQHIIGLILNMFQQFWPNLLEEGLIYKLKTPQIIATAGKKSYEFYDKASYLKWKEKGIKHSYKFYKGLGTFTTKDFRQYIVDDTYFEQLTVVDSNDFDSIDLAFDKKRADDRKEWLKDNR